MVLATFIHALVFLAFWLTNLPFHKTLNDFLVGATRLRVNFLMIFMVFAGLVALWSAAHLVLRRDPRRAGPAWLYLAVGIFFLVFFYASFIVLFLMNPVQLYRLGQVVLYFRIFVDAGILLFLAWNLRRWVKGGSGMGKIILPAGLLVLWLIPIFWTPGNIVRGSLPERPRLIAHRGASTLAPENTLASMQAAASLGIYGLETDITVSADGKLFLMHDATLSRTTDVAQIFPKRSSDPADTFTWNELSRLDAGSWYEGRAASSKEPVPALEAMLPVVGKNNLHLIYDLRIPPAGHPYREQTLDMCLKQIQAAGVTSLTWVLTAPENIARVQSVLPGATLAAGIGYTDTPPSPETLVASGYRVVNSAYGLSDDRIHAYQAADLWVNLWVVDEAWQYSRLWLAGADSVTSNYVQDLLALPEPVLALPYETYLLVWGCLGLIAAIVYGWTARH